MTVTINVALRRKGDQPPKHIFRTAKDSLQGTLQACMLARKLALLFTPDRYEITVSVESTHSEYLNWEDEEEYRKLIEESAS